MTTERHPLGFFLPEGARLLMLGSFPPPKARWSMDFFYPNIQNDMWRIMGLLFYADKDHFLATPKAFDRDKAIRFCRERGIALGDTAREVIRQKANASDKFLEVIVPIDLEAVLSELPACEAIVVTGQKALETLLGVLASAEDPVVVEAPKAFDRDKAIRFCRERGIALGDTAREVIRQKANASDKFLEVIVPIDLEAVLSELPACEAIVVTGQKALETLLGVLASAEDPVVVEAPKVGSSVTFVFAGRRLRLYRMPSTSRAYPKPLAEKAAAYGAMLREVGIL